MSEPKVRLERDGAVATMVLDRPEKLNALDQRMLDELEACIAEIDRDNDLRVAILTGASEKAFCVGGDIAAWGALEPLDMWRHWVKEGTRIFDRLAALRIPTIAAINGYCFGGGLELALACDIRIAALETDLAFPEVKIAIVPGWAGTKRLPEIIGPARAKQMIFSGARVGAVKAEQWGLVNEAVPRADLMARVKELAGEIAANGPAAVQIAKIAIDGRDGGLELLAGALAKYTEDGREGVASFREKRAPHFNGR
ncbi:MAG: enoyl-CoA hydratase/isomerase family protein [Thermomicrobiales bacterium]